MSGNRIYKGRHPSLILLLIFISLYTGILIFSLVRYYSNDPLMFYFSGVMLIFCLFALVLTLFRVFKKPFEVQFNSESILLNGKSVETNVIKQIFVMGYFKPIIGIKLISNKLVPYELSFKFLGEEDQGLADLKTWANENHVTLTHKHFIIK